MPLPGSHSLESIRTTRKTWFKFRCWGSSLRCRDWAEPGLEETQVLRTAWARRNISVASCVVLCGVVEAIHTCTSSWPRRRLYSGHLSSTWLPGAFMCACRNAAGVFLPTELRPFLCCVDVRISQWHLLEGMRRSFSSGGLHSSCVSRQLWCDEAKWGMQPGEAKILE